MTDKGYDDSPSTLQDGSMPRRRSSNPGLWLAIKLLLILIPLYCVQYSARKYWKQTTGSVPESHIGTLRWFKCEEPVVPGMDCGSIVVPLDHLNHTKGTSNIALARYKATSRFRRGTIFLNPGGPGGSGVQFAIRGISLISQLVGPHYDIVGFDPRGIGKTIPAVRCFPNPVHRQFFVSNTVFEQGFTVSSNLSDPTTRNYLVQQYKEFLALKKTQAELCAENVGDALKYMGTTTVARDIDFMATAMDGEDALINYYGGSYGTILGAYLVNMFPDRVGRVAIDGVANPVLWAAKPSQYWHSDWIVSAEDTYQVFLKECSKAGSESCPLANRTNEDPKEIERRIDNFLDNLYDAPLPVPQARRPGYITAGAVRALLLICMEAPRSWPQCARFLANAMSGDGANLLNLLLPQYAPYPLPDLSSAVDLQRLAVTCLDSPPPESPSDFPTAEELADIGLSAIQDVSRNFGMSVSISEPDGGCQFWPVRPLERFTGPWNHTLKNPILIISNTADPVTPLRSGRLVNSLLGNSSRLLIQDSPGHCSLGLASLCTMNAFRAYFINGTLPPNEHICPVDESPFPKSGAEFGIEGKVLSKHEEHLMATAKEVGQWLISHKLSSSLGHQVLHT